MPANLSNFDPALKDQQGRTKMPAVSKAQRRFFGMAEHHPEKVRGKVPDMTKDQMHDFAATSEEGLPNKVKSAMKSAMRKGKKHGTR